MLICHHNLLLYPCGTLFINLRLTYFVASTAVGFFQKKLWAWMCHHNLAECFILMHFLAHSLILAQSFVVVFSQPNTRNSSLKHTGSMVPCHHRMHMKHFCFLNKHATRQITSANQLKCVGFGSVRVCVPFVEGVCMCACFTAALL